MVRANTQLWTPEELQRVKAANVEIFSNPQQQALENLRLDQINNGEGLVVTEETRQMLIENKFPFPTRWLHDKYKVNIDPGAFNLHRSMAREASDFSNPFGKDFQ
jgi:ribosomal protein L30/L7E